MNMGIVDSLAAAKMVTQALSHWGWITFGLRQVCLCGFLVFLVFTYSLAQHVTVEQHGKWHV